MQDGTDTPQENLEAAVAELEQILTGLIPQDVLDLVIGQDRPVEDNISDVNAQVNEEGGTFAPSETGDVVSGAQDKEVADPPAPPEDDLVLTERSPIDTPGSDTAPVSVNVSDVNAQANGEGGDLFPSESGDVINDSAPAEDLFDPAVPAADPLLDPALDGLDGPLLEPPVDDLFVEPTLVDPLTDPYAEPPVDPLADPAGYEPVSGAEETDGNPETVDMDPETPGEQITTSALDLTNPTNPASPNYIDMGDIMDSPL